MKDSFLKIFILISIWVGFLYGGKFLRKTYLADVYYANSQNLLKEANIKEAQKYADLAVRLNPYEANYYRGRAKVNTVALVKVPIEEQSILKEEILSDLEYAVSLNEDNLVIIRNSIPLYFFLSVFDLSMPADSNNIDYEYLPDARAFFNFAKSKYDHDVGVISLIAKYEKRLGLEEEYARSVGLVEKLRPDLLEWHESFR